ncbi:MAG: hypothetical protein KAH08_05645 [Methylococcales bacterium]|nr:hypothetical protein [Methylococcales bacterium]
MKYLITLSLLLTGLYSTHLYAQCQEKDKSLFFCEIQKSKKILEVCDKGKTISYSFGHKNKKPELFFTIPKEKVFTYQSGPISPTESYSITIPRGDTKYRVFWGVDKTSKEYPVTSGVIVNVKSKDVANLTCINKTATHYLMAIKLKPDGKDEKTESVKALVFSVDVVLSKKANAKMAEMNEKIIISSLFSGERAVPLKEAVDSDDPNLISLKEVEIEIAPNETAHFNAVLFEKEKFDKIKPNTDQEKRREYELTINAHSARKAHKDNLLTCSTFIEEDAGLLPNKTHIKLSCSLIGEPLSPKKAQVMGKAKLEYENALQACINKNVSGRCRLKIADKFKGTERVNPDASKLAGLVDTVGSYERKNDRWDFSLDETSGFYLIHTKSGEKKSVFLADHLEYIGGNRYAIYADIEEGKNAGYSRYSWALIYNLKTKRYDLEVKIYNKTTKKWAYLIYPAT